jgi:hypothetical protein
MREHRDIKSIMEIDGVIVYDSEAEQLGVATLVRPTAPSRSAVGGSAAKSG